MITQVLAAELTWTGAELAEGVEVAVDERGRIAAVGTGLPGPRTELPERALLPGLVNAHSHAFQRGLRGRSESFPSGPGSFWTWREAMYELVDKLDADAVYAWSRRAFDEMRAGGVTAVGEFHYLHHAARPGDHALDAIVLRAAAAAGLRIVLLQTYYAAAGIGRPLAPEQWRFGADGLDAYWRGVDALALGALQSVGAAIHSLRAVPLEEAVTLRGEAQRRGLVVHMHLEEQPGEVEEVVAAWGATPCAVTLERLAPDARFTAVHCTQTTRDELAALVATGAGVCVCPLTEADLGDGLPRLGAEEGGLDTLLHGAHLSVGSDSNQRIDLVEEMRWLELGQRLRTGERGILGRGAPAAATLRAATEGGARALGLSAGRIAPGLAADFALLDLTHPALAGADPAHLAAAWVFGGGADVVAGTCVGGQWRFAPGHAP